MRLIDADALADALFEKRRNYPQWVADTIGGMPTVDVDALLKEQGKKQIKLTKKHVIIWSRNDEFSMKKLYEAICETLLDEGELFIERTDDHEKVEFVFYVSEGR